MLALLKDIFRPLYHFLTSRQHRTNYRLRSAYSRDSRYTKGIIHFMGFQLEVTDTVSVMHQFEEVFLHHSYRFVSPTSNPVILDCGANVGMSCVYFKNHFPDCTLHAFEADPAIFQLLQRNMARNNITERTHLYNQAIWITNGYIQFDQEGADAGHIVAENAKQGTQVEAVRLRELIKSHHPDFLKIDIEGAEVEVLTDCDGAMEGISMIFVEYHSPSAKPQQLGKMLDVLSKNGFRYYMKQTIDYRAPFDLPWKGSDYDLQLNIFCYRISKDFE